MIGTLHGRVSELGLGALQSITSVLNLTLQDTLTRHSLGKLFNLLLFIHRGLEKITFLFFSCDQPLLIRLQFSGPSLELLQRPGELLFCFDKRFWRLRWQLLFRLRLIVLFGRLGCLFGFFLD